MSDRSLYVKALDGSLRPFNDEAADYVNGCKVGQVLELKETKVRNGDYHRLFFAILKLVSDNSNPHITAKAALLYAKMAAGVGEFEPDTRGGQHFIPGSISFAKMDQHDFKSFVQTAIPPLVGRFMVGTAPDDLIAEAMSLAA